MPVRPVRFSSDACFNPKPPTYPKPMQEPIRPGLTRLRDEASEIVNLVDVQSEAGEFADRAWQTLCLGLPPMGLEAVVAESEGDRLGWPGEQGIGSERVAGRHEHNPPGHGPVFHDPIEIVGPDSWDIKRDGQHRLGPTLTAYSGGSLYRSTLPDLPHLSYNFSAVLPSTYGGLGVRRNDQHAIKQW